MLRAPNCESDSWVATSADKRSEEWSLLYLLDRMLEVKEIMLRSKTD